MRTVEIYKFKELSSEAQQKALESFRNFWDTSSDMPAEFLRDDMEMIQNGYDGGDWVKTFGIDHNYIDDIYWDFGSEQAYVTGKQPISVFIELLDDIKNISPILNDFINEYGIDIDLEDKNIIDYIDDDIDQFVQEKFDEEEYNENWSDEEYDIAFEEYTEQKKTQIEKELEDISSIIESNIDELNSELSKTVEFYNYPDDEYLEDIIVSNDYEFYSDGSMYEE